MLEMLTAASSVLGKEQGPTGDTVSLTQGPVTATVGGGALIERSDSWIWLVALAVLAVVVLRK